MTTARELLEQVHAAKGEPSESLLAEIGAYLGEPVHVGDTITIVPTQGSCWSSGTGWGDDRVWNTDVPEGLEWVEHKSSYENKAGETVPFSYREYRWPEAGEARYLSGTDYKGAFVVEIHGRRYRVDLHVGMDGDAMFPDGVVTFTRTDSDLTEFQTWDHDEAVAKYRASRVAELEATRKELAAESDGKWVKYLHEDIKRAEREIADCDRGEVRLRHPFHIQVFGQPRFIQNEMFPVHEGRSGMCLASIETGWGDAGNLNVMFACDADGVPARIWLEASCH